MCSEFWVLRLIFRQKRSAHKTYTHFPLYFHLFNIFFILPPFPIQHFPTAAAAGSSKRACWRNFSSQLNKKTVSNVSSSSESDANCTANEISTRRARRRDFFMMKVFFFSAVQCCFLQCFICAKLFIYANCSRRFSLCFFLRCMLYIFVMIFSYSIHSFHFKCCHHWRRPTTTTKRTGWKRKKCVSSASRPQQVSGWLGINWELICISFRTQPDGLSRLIMMATRHDVI